jgi:hypothetical protein
MASGITSTVSGTNTTYVITDQGGNTATIIATATPGGLSFSGSGFLEIDGQIMMQTLLTMLTTGLRPNVIMNTVASFSN